MEDGKVKMAAAIPSVLKEILRAPAGVTAAALGDAATFPYRKRLAEKSFAVPHTDWQPYANAIRKQMDLKDVPVFPAEKLRSNALFVSGKIPPQFAKQVAEALGIADIKTLSDLPRQGGVIVGAKAPVAVLAHELGHALQHKQRGYGLVRPRLGQLSSAMSVFGALIGAMTGRYAPGALGRVLVKRPGALRRIAAALSGKPMSYVGGVAGGGGLGYAMSHPVLAEESGASRHGVKAIESILGAQEATDARKRLDNAYKTYRTNALTHTLAGTVAGLL